MDAGAVEGADEGTDRWAIEQRWVSVTPLRLDLTDEAMLDQSREQRPMDENLAAAVSPPKSSPEAAKEVELSEAAVLPPRVS